MPTSLNDNQNSDKQRGTRRAKESRGRIRRIFLGPEIDDEDPGPFFKDAPIQRSAAVVTQPYRGTDSELNDDLDRVGLNLIGLSSLHIRDKWTAIQFRDALAEHLAKLDGFVAREEADGRKLLERKGTAAAAPKQVAEVIEAAVKVEVFTGVPTSLDTDDLGSGMTALTANSHALTDETMHGLPRITKGMPDPRLPKLQAPEITQVLPIGQQFPPFGHADSDAPHPGVLEPASPLHAGAESAPVPAGSASQPAPLPRRKPVHWISTAEHPNVHGVTVNPFETEIVAGDWVLDEGSDCGGGPAWGLVKDIAVGGHSTVIEFASGAFVEIGAGRTVRMLTSSDAKALLERESPSVGDAQVSA